MERALICCLPKDIVLLLFLEWLDGPSACALASTCKKFRRHFYQLKAKQRLEIRLRPLDREHKAKLVLQTQVEVCIHCFQPYLRTQRHCCLGTLKRDIGRPLSEKCKTCSSSGESADLFPWRSSPKLWLECFTCQNSITIASWIGKDMQCVYCGIRCDSCQGLVVVCPYCEEGPMSHIDFKWHLQEACTGNSWARWAQKRILPSSVGFQKCLVPGCGKKFRRRKFLDNHMQLVHLLSLAELGWAASVWKRKTFTCPLCQQVFPAILDRERHIKQKHKTMYPRRINGSGVKDERFPFSCPKCREDLSYREIYTHTCSAVLERPSQVDAFSRQRSLQRRYRRLMVEK